MNYCEQHIPEAPALTAGPCLAGRKTGKPEKLGRAEGFAAPEGGNRSGARIKLTTPVVSLFGIDLPVSGQEAWCIPASNADPDCNGLSLSLLVDLMRADGTVGQRAEYTYENIISSGCWMSGDDDDDDDGAPLCVTGGEGVYRMRAVAMVLIGNVARPFECRMMHTCYNGTATVSADGRFRLDGPLQPYNAAATFTLSDRYGQVIRPAAGESYCVSPTGIGVDQQLMENDIIQWTDCSTRPRYTLTTADDILRNGLASPQCAYALVPGTVPATWYEGAERYAAPGSTTPRPDRELQGSHEVLFTVSRHKRGVPAPVQTWTVKITSPRRKLTLEAGRRYHFTLVLPQHGRDAIISNIEAGSFVRVENGRIIAD